MRYTRNKRPAAPRLVPTGNVDDVLLTGKIHGKNLTLFQSIGLAVLGLCVVLGIGVSAIAGEFILQSKFERTGLPYTKELGFGILMCLLGGMWIAMGLFGILKAVRKKK
jgi:hypothetical protein